MRDFVGNVYQQEQNYEGLEMPNEPAKVEC